MNKVYEYVTSRIIEQLEKGVIPWHKPWGGSRFPVNYISRKPYRGINLYLLDRPGEYLTFKQVNDLDGSIKKGAKASMVVFWKITLKKTDESEDMEVSDGNENFRKSFILRYYNVFHIDDCEGINSKFPSFENEALPEAQFVIDSYKDAPEIRQDKGRAYYVPSMDYIGVPPITDYPVRDEYYSTLFHEMIHSTGHSKRLARVGIMEQAASFGSEVYSYEELIAEMGAAMLCSVVGIENRIIENSAAYIQNWLGALKNDKALVVRAAQAAQKASDYILGNDEQITTEGGEQ